MGRRVGKNAKGKARYKFVVISVIATMQKYVCTSKLLKHDKLRLKFSGLK